MTSTIASTLALMMRASDGKLLVPFGYTSTELAIRLVLLPTEPPKPDQR